MPEVWDDKDPVEVLDFYMDWTKRLHADETIETSSWSVETGLTKNSDAHDDKKCVVWVSGGDESENYNLVNTITTNQGRTLKKTGVLQVRRL